MENATKALLIAAAVLVAILIISLGIAVYNNASNTMSSADLREYEIQQFNEKFTKYQGDNVSGSDANALIQTAFNHNNAQEDTSTCVIVNAGVSGAEKTVVYKSITASSVPKNLSTASRYKITCTINTKTKLVETITITQK